MREFIRNLKRLRRQKELFKHNWGNIRELSRPLLIEPLEERIVPSGGSILLPTEAPVSDQIEAEGGYDFLQGTASQGEHLVFQNPGSVDGSGWIVYGEGFHNQCNRCL